MSQTASVSRSRLSAPDLARRHPVTMFLVILIVPSWAIYAVVLLTGMPFMAAKVAELVFLILAPVLVSRWVGGRAAVRRLFSGLTRWRLGLPRYLMILVAMPALTLLVAVTSGTLSTPTGGWANMALIYGVFVLAGALTGNLWEETAWSGFMQGSLMARRGLLVGSLLTAVPFALIHLPLAFEANGLGTSTTDVLVTWGYLIVLAPFMRYLIGTVLVDTSGSVLGAGLLHASMNASGALAAVQGFWQYPAALILLTLLVAGYRTLRGRSAVLGFSPALATDEGN
jgi:membrane protease YdiL (CAAX protease family)